MFSLSFNMSDKTVDLSYSLHRLTQEDSKTICLALNIINKVAKTSRDYSLTSGYTTLQINPPNRVLSDLMPRLLHRGSPDFNVHLENIIDALLSPDALDDGSLLCQIDLSQTPSAGIHKIKTELASTIKERRKALIGNSIDIPPEKFKVWLRNPHSSIKTDKEAANCLPLIKIDVSEHGASAFQFASRTLRNNSEAAIECIEIDPKTFTYLEHEVRNRPEVAISAARKDKENLKLMAAEGLLACIQEGICTLEEVPSSWVDRINKLASLKENPPATPPPEEIQRPDTQGPPICTQEYIDFSDPSDVFIAIKKDFSNIWKIELSFSNFFYMTYSIFCALKARIFG